MAGKDITPMLAKNSLSRDLLQFSCINLDTLSDEELVRAKNWLKFYSEKYNFVGSLAPCFPNI